MILKVHAVDAPITRYVVDADTQHMQSMATGWQKTPAAPSDPAPRKQLTNDGIREYHKSQNLNR